MINPNAPTVPHNTNDMPVREDERIPLDEVIASDDAASETEVPLTDLGGVTGRSRVIDENSDAPQAGAAGHPGIDEDTG